MRSLRITGPNLVSLVHLTLFGVALFTYLVAPDDIVWRLVRGSPHARWLEHTAFGGAAVLLGAALLIRFRESTDTPIPRSQPLNKSRLKVADLFQAIGIGSLLPVPGFLILVLGEVSLCILPQGRWRAPSDKREIEQGTSQAPQSGGWRDALFQHAGLCCAFASMAVFSVVLVDRIADVLFASSALVSLVVKAQNSLQPRTESRKG